MWIYYLNDERIIGKIKKRKYNLKDTIVYKYINNLKEIKYIVLIIDKIDKKSNILTCHKALLKIENGKINE